MSTAKREYQALMIEHKRRQERNGRLLAKLENIEKKAAFLQAKTDRIKSLKSIYRNQVEKKPVKNINVYSNINNRIITERVPIHIGPNNYDFSYYDPLHYSNYRYERIYNEPNPLYTLKPITLEDAIEEISRRFVLVPKEAENINRHPYEGHGDFKYKQFEEDDREYDEQRDENERRKQEFRKNRESSHKEDKATVKFEDISTDIKKYLKERSKDLKQYENDTDDSENKQEIGNVQYNVNEEDISSKDKAVEVVPEINDDENVIYKDELLKVKIINQNEPKVNEFKTIHTPDDVKEKTISKSVTKVTHKIKNDNIESSPDNVEIINVIPHSEDEQFKSKEPLKQNVVQKELENNEHIPECKKVEHVLQETNQKHNEPAKQYDENSQKINEEHYDKNQIEQQNNEYSHQQNYDETQAKNQNYSAESNQEYTEQIHPEHVQEQEYTECVQQDYVDGQVYPEQSQQGFVEGQVYPEQNQQVYVEGEAYPEQIQQYDDGQIYSEQVQQEYVEGQVYPAQTHQEYVEGQLYSEQGQQEYIDGQVYPEQAGQEYAEYAADEYSVNNQQYAEQPEIQYTEQTSQEHVQDGGQEYVEESGQVYAEPGENYAEYTEQTGQEYMEQTGQDYTDVQNCVEPNITGHDPGQYTEDVQQYYDQNQYTTGDETSTINNEQYYQENQQEYYNQDTSGQVYDGSSVDPNYVQEQSIPRESTSKYDGTYQDENYSQQDIVTSSGDTVNLENAKPLKILESDTDHDGSKMEESSKQDSDFDFSVAQ